MAGSYSTRGRSALLGLVALSLAACAIASETKRNGSTMNNAPQTLWQTIERLAKQMPFTPAKVEQALGATLTIKTHTPHMTQWIGGGPISLGDDLHIEGSSLALGPNGEFNDRSGLTIELGGACITLEQVRQEFGALQVTQAPRGHSANESTVHVSSQPWGRISFAFKARDPDCLAHVGIRPLQTD